MVAVAVVAVIADAIDSADTTLPTLTNSSETSMTDGSSAVFRPAAVFTQTCGACGCIFSVEIESRRNKDELQQTYSCPHCQHHLCNVASPRPPRVTMVSRGTRAPALQRQPADD
jgi:formamidopyrimidine-DNA glycosylase